MAAAAAVAVAGGPPPRSDQLHMHAAPTALHAPMPGVWAHGLHQPARPRDAPAHRRGAAVRSCAVQGVSPLAGGAMGARGGALPQARCLPARGMNGCLPVCLFSLFSRHDNIFYTLHGKKDEGDAPQLLSYTIDVGRAAFPPILCLRSRPCLQPAQALTALAGICCLPRVQCMDGSDRKKRPSPCRSSATTCPTCSGSTPTATAHRPCRRPPPALL